MNLPDSLRRTIRTLIQLVASGGLTWLTDQLAHDLDPVWVPYMMGTYTLVVVLAQNYLEDTGIAGKTLPAILKAPANPGENPVPKDAGKP